MTFFDVAGAPIDPPSITPSPFASTPALPAEKVIVMSAWFQMKSSVFALSVVYAPAASVPQEFECTRAPAVYAC